MEYYVEQTVKRMEMGNKTILGDISLFNTTIAFDRNNIESYLIKFMEDL